LKRHIRDQHKGQPIPDLSSQPIPDLSSQPIPDLSSQPIPGLASQPIPGLASQSDLSGNVMTRDDMFALKIMELIDRRMERRDAKGAENASRPNSLGNEKAVRPSNPAVGVSEPLVKSLQHALQQTQNALLNVTQNNFLIPKTQIAGFSCHVCSKCLNPESPLPIKDLGYDLTAQAKHVCKAHQGGKISDPDRALKDLTSSNISMLLAYIDFWSPGDKIIIAKLIDLPTTNSKNSGGDQVVKLFDIPNKYYFVHEMMFQSLPWAYQLYSRGSMVPTRQELIDFCKLCCGTYAILSVSYHNVRVTEYYLLYLAKIEHKLQNW